MVRGQTDRRQCLDEAGPTPRCARSCTGRIAGPYRDMLTQMAKESGIDTPTADDLVRIDRARKGKRLSNEEWTSKTDPEAGIARLKDGRTHLAYKHTSDITVNTA